MSRTKPGTELTIGMFGLYPNYLTDKDDVIMGSDLKMIRTLSKN